MVGQLERNKIKMTTKGYNNPAPEIFTPTIHPSLVENIPPGFYEIDSNMSYGQYFKKLLVEEKKIFSFQDNASDLIIKDIEKFWSLKDRYAKYKMPFKRGILMHGPPGCGKSSIISLLVQSILNSKGIVIKFHHNTSLFKGIMRTFRAVQPNLPVLVLMEDLNYILEECSRSEVLNLLDGVEKFSHNTVYLATTNYIDKLEDNIKNRPSRFDMVVDVGSPSAETRKLYFQYLLLGDDRIDNLDKWVEDSAGLSFAHLQELFQSVFLFGNDYEGTIARIRKMVVVK